MKSMLKKINKFLHKTSLLNDDGKLNGKVAAGLASQGIIFLEVLFSYLGYTKPVKWGAIALLLTLLFQWLATAGLLDDPSTVSDKPNLKVINKGGLNNGNETSTQK